MGDGGLDGCSELGRDVRWGARVLVWIAMAMNTVRKLEARAKKKNSPIEELNLGLNLRKVVCYHYTNRTHLAINTVQFLN